MMITQTLAQFITNTNYHQIPENVINKAKLCFTDLLGVTLRGSETKSGAAVKDLMKDLTEGDTSKGPSTVIGQGKNSALNAALINGIFAHSLDLDDGHRQAQIHPGACVIPAALSLCEAQNKSTAEFINSMVVGYEVAISVGMMVNPEHRERGFHTTGTCGTLGAAAAASKALNLNKDQIISALGLAGTQAAGLLESDHSGSMAKHLHAGKAAQSGILSALLAQRDFSGSKTILEGNEGFLTSMTGLDLRKIASYSESFNMGKFRIMEVYFKIYPVCRHLHSSIEALLHIISKNHIRLEEIEGITVKTYKIAAEHDNYHPTTTEAIRQSLPVSMAIAILNNAQGLDNPLELNKFLLNQTLNQEVENISGKIFIEHADDFDTQYPYRRPAEVRIETENNVYKKRVDLPRGEPEKPLKKSDIIDKFYNLNPKVDGQALQIIDDIESYNEINDFMDDLNSYLH